MCVLPVGDGEAAALELRFDRMPLPAVPCPFAGADGGFLSTGAIWIPPSSCVEDEARCCGCALDLLGSGNCSTLRGASLATGVSERCARVPYESIAAMEAPVAARAALPPSVLAEASLTRRS